VSAAQAVTSGLPSSTAGTRGSSGGAAAGRGDASFRDALDTVARSGDASESGRGRVTTDEARGRDGSDSGDEAGAQVADAVRGETVSALSQILATLSGTPHATDVEAETGLPRSEIAGACSGDDALEAGPWLPGQVGDGEETLDAERLRALMSSASGPAQSETEPAAIALKATVTRQETHLALGKDSSRGLALVADGGAAGAELDAVQTRAAEGARPAATAIAGEAGQGGQALRAGAVADDMGRGAGTALADQGIAGQDGRSADGRGSAGTGAGAQQQQGSGAFMAMLAGGAAQAGAAREAADAGFAHDPVSDQIAAQVRAGLKSDGLGEASSDGVVKVLQLELKPANLGSVTVRLALKDNAISIHIEAQRLDTLAVVEREREALASALASAGYEVDSITAAPQSEMGRSTASLAASGDSGASAAQGGNPGQSSGQGQGLSNSSDGEGRPREAGPGQAGYRHPSDDKDTSGGGIRRDAGGIYV
jgi:chemotaxis protein MotD